MVALWKTYGEKAWQQLYENAASNIEQVLEATPNKTAAIRPLTTHHENYPSYSRGPHHMDDQRQYDHVEPIYNRSVLIQDVTLKTSREQWTIETDGERRSGRSVLAAWHDDDDIYIYIYIYIHECVCVWVYTGFEFK